MAIPLSLRLARRELRNGFKGFRIFVLCLALGVAAIATVGNLSQALIAGLTADAGRLLGGDVEIRLTHRGWTDDQADFVKTQAEVAELIELRTMARTIPDREQSLVELKAVDQAYPIYGEVRLKSGRALTDVLGQKNGIWQAVVEANLLRRLGIEVGDRIEVGELDLLIADEIIKEPDRSTNGFTLGPRVMVSLPAIHATGLIREGSLVRYLYRLRLPAGTDLPVWLNKLSEAFPKAGWRLRDVRNGTPSLKRFINRMRLFLTLVGLSALLVGGLGIANGVKSYLDGKVSAIAIYKCVGAPANLVFLVYLWQVLAVAAISIGIGLLIGGALPLLLSGLAANYLPFEAQLGVFPEPLALATLYGLLTTLAFALWPLAQARETAPATLFRSLTSGLTERPKLIFYFATGLAVVALGALSIMTASERNFALVFVCGSAIAFAAFYFAGKAVMVLTRMLPPVRRPGLRLAIANLYRPGAATVSVTLSFGLGLSVLVTVMAIRANFEYLVAEQVPDQAPAYFFLDILPDQIEGFTAEAKSVEGVGEVAHTASLRGRIVSINDVPAEKITPAPNVAWVLRGDRGLTYRRMPPEGSAIVEGTWWPDDYSGPPLISMGLEAAKGLGVEVGDHMTLNILGREITAEVSNLRRIDWSSFGINFVLIFSPGLLESAPHTFIATATADVNAELALEKAVTGKYRNVTAIRVRDALETVNSILENISVAVRATASVSLLAGTLVLAGAVAAGHRRRVYDAVVLKVLGATRADIIGAYLLEYLILGLIVAILAAVVGTLSAYFIVTEFMGGRWYFPPGTIAATMAICMSITVSAGIIATFAVLGQKPAPLLRNE